MNFSKVAALLAVSSVGALGLVFGGCGGEDPPPVQPAANCNLKDTCVTADKDCVALVDNAGKTDFGVRMSQILISKPAALAPETFVGGVVTSGVSLKQDACFLNGTGDFSWLIHFDTTTNMVCTGGAKPAADPLADGYSFVNGPEMINGQTFDIKPIKFAADLANNTFEVAMGQDIIVPIYADTGTVLLPLKKARIVGGKLSADHNCVGSFNAAGLDPYSNCLPYAPEKQFSFINDGKIEGYITLEEADAVIVATAKSSLCVLLGGDKDAGTPSKCARDANMKIVFKGDWCDATNAPADASCSDSVALAADFAASAVKINGGCPIQ